MFGQHVRHALARAVAPQRDHDALASRLQRVDVLGHGLEHVLVGLAALGGEIVAGAGGDLDGVGGARAPRTASAAPARHSPGARAIRLRRDRAGPAAAACRARRCSGLIERLLARLIIVGDLGEALVGGFLGQRLE